MFRFIRRFAGLAWGCIITLVSVSLLVSAWLITQNTFLANHAHVILVAQLAALTTCAGMVVGQFWHQDGPRGAAGAFIVAVIATVSVYALLADQQAGALADQISSHPAKPGLLTQLGLSATGYGDVHVVEAHIREITFGYTALGLALVAFLVSTVSCIVIEHFRTPELSYRNEADYDYASRRKH